MTMPHITWAGTATAQSSISHGGETRGTISMLRREAIIQPDGSTELVPVISGNSLRGRLRRVGEELLRDALGYEGQLTAAAAHALRSGGALAKTSSEPLSGSRLKQVRAFLPQVGVFGMAASGRIIDGCLSVGKLIPYVAETSHLTGVSSGMLTFDITQIETYTRADESNDHDAVDISDQTDADPDNTQMLFRIETFLAGCRFDCRLHLQRPTELEAAFFSDILASYQQRALIGGRSAIGHGHLALDLTVTPTPPDVDWRAFLAEHTADALDALTLLR